MNLDNFIIPEDKLFDTPSREDGCPKELEVDLRTAGCDQIQLAGRILKLPQASVSTAQVIFQRFFYVRSFVKFSLMNIVMACIFLGAKVSDFDLLTEEVVHVWHYLKQMQNSTSKYMQVKRRPTDGEYAELEKVLHDHEQYLLTDLGFCVYVNLPHEMFMEYLAKFDLNENKQMAVLTWSYMNDCFRTNLCVRFTSDTLMCASILLAANFLKIPLPQNPPWWTEFDTDYDSIKLAVAELINLRARPRQSLRDLEGRLKEVKENFSRKLIESVLSIHSPPSTSDSVASNSYLNAALYSLSHLTSANNNIVSTTGTHTVPQSLSETSSVPETGLIPETSSIPTMPPTGPTAISSTAQAKNKQKTGSNISSVHTVSTPADSKTSKSILGRRTSTSKLAQTETIPLSKCPRTVDRSGSSTATNISKTHCLASTSILGKRKCSNVGLATSQISSPPTTIKKRRRSNKP